MKKEETKFNIDMINMVYTENMDSQSIVTLINSLKVHGIKLDDKDVISLGNRFNLMDSVHQHKICHYLMTKHKDISNEMPNVVDFYKNDFINSDLAINFIKDKSNRLNSKLHIIENTSNEKIFDYVLKNANNDNEINSLYSNDKFVNLMNENIFGKTILEKVINKEGLNKEETKELLRDFNTLDGYDKSMVCHNLMTNNKYIKELEENGTIYEEGSDLMEYFNYDFVNSSDSLNFIQNEELEEHLKLHFATNSSNQEILETLFLSDENSLIQDAINDNYSFTIKEFSNLEEIIDKDFDTTQNNIDDNENNEDNKDKKVNKAKESHLNKLKKYT